MRFVEGQGKSAQLTRAGKIITGVVLLLLIGPPLAIALVKLNIWLWSL